MRLIGRADELRRARVSLGRGESVLLAGPPGAGKTALASALLQGVPHVEGGALRLFRHQPYFALCRAFGHELHGSADDVATVVLRALGERILFIDDLHWADDATVEVLGALAPRVRVVVTARMDELAPGASTLVDGTTLIALAPLTRRAATMLARRLRPAIDEASVRAIVANAGGNPLMLEALVDTGGTRASLLAAVVDRLSSLAAEERGALARLALAGRPLPMEPAHVGDGLELFVVHGAQGVSIRHPLLADAIIGSLSEGEVSAAHTELADALGGVEAVQHAVAGGKVARARAMVVDLLHQELSVADRTELLRLLAMATDSSGPDACDAWLAAASALIEVGRWADGLDAAQRALAFDGPRRVEAWCCAGRARWFLSDIDGAEHAFRLALEVAPENEPEALRILLEHAFLRVRDRRPGATELAREAHSLAHRVGAEQARASSVLGAALLYEGASGWREELQSAIDGATRAGDHDLVAAATYHLVSGLGFIGNLRAAAEIARDQSHETRELGLDTWTVHFEAVDLYNSVLMADCLSASEVRCRSFLSAHPVFRNRYQIELALVLSLADRGELDAAASEAARFRAQAVGDEAHAFALVAAAELAWLQQDTDACVRAVLELRDLGDVWFGIRVVVEATAALACAMEGLDHVIDVPTIVLPVLWPVLDEIDGWERWRAGDARGAQESFDRAATAWIRHEIPRFAVRAHSAASFAASAGSIGSPRPSRDAALAVARRHHLRGHIQRLGGRELPWLTQRELEVLRGVARGMTSFEIAAELHITPATVDDHVKHARTKLGAASRVEAARIATMSA